MSDEKMTPEDVEQKRLEAEAKAKERRRSKAVGEFSETLTGFEEIGISEAFKAELEDLSAGKQVRALGFVYFKRQGQTHEDAKTSALALSAGALLDLFVNEEGAGEDELFPDEPVTAAGKDDYEPPVRLMS